MRWRSCSSVSLLTRLQMILACALTLRRSVITQASVRPTRPSITTTTAAALRGVHHGAGSRTAMSEARRSRSWNAWGTVCPDLVTAQIPVRARRLPARNPSGHGSLAGRRAVKR